jgi:hypothetical protein
VGHDREMWTYLSAFPDAYETRERFHRWMDEALASSLLCWASSI